MEQDKTIHSEEIVFSQKTSILMQESNACYGVESNDWRYLRTLIDNNKTTVNWFEIIASIGVGAGLSCLIAYTTTPDISIWFGHIGCGVLCAGILSIAVCVFLKKKEKTEIGQIKHFFEHIESKFPKK